MSGEMQYVVELAETIGPRPATTDAEADAATYIEDVFSSRGLEVERQEFDSPRTYGWAYAIYHLLTVASAVASRWYPVPALMVAGIVAILMWLELDLRFGLMTIMPKGPSQNVIGRYVPRVRRNERLHRVVVVAHYDTARASLAFSPRLVRGFSTAFGLMKWLTVAVPILILVSATPWLRALPGAWRHVPFYVTVAASVYLLFPLFVNVHRELFMKPVPGANDNASGVAAMLGVMARVVPEPDVASAPVEAVRHTEEETLEAEVMPEGAVLNLTSAESPRRALGSWADGDDDVPWSDPVRAGLGQTTMDVSATPPARVPREAPPIDDDLFGSADLFGEETPSPDRPVRPRDEGAAPEGPSEGGEGVRDWLGVDKDFDARAEGRNIGSWDNFDEDDDDPGWKGGSAAADSLDDPDFPASEAARIRRKVTQTGDRDLSEKEVWFVATGAEEPGSFGMRALLRDYGHDLQDAMIINIDNVGSGTVYYVSSEGMARRYRSDRRLMGAARRAVGEEGLSVSSIDYRGLSTDASLALARGYRAMSVMAFDINGRIPDWHWETDTVDAVAEENLAQTAELVCAIIRAL